MPIDKNVSPCIDIKENDLLDRSEALLERVLRDQTTGRNIFWATHDYEPLGTILQHQVFGFAPSEIIYRIATRYILGFDTSLRPEQSNFRQVDTVPYAKAGRMEELINREFAKD